MRIRVTGASGWIGSAVVPELLGAGHEVLGLARSDAAAGTVARLGAAVQRGSLDDVASLRAAAQGVDGVVHLGYHHDFSQMAEAAAMDRRAIEAFADVLAGTDGALFAASGVVGMGPGATELDTPDPGLHPRVATGELVVSLAERGIRSGVVRFAPTVHGAGDRGFVASLSELARRTGVSGFLGDGSNRWPAVHRLDAGVLVRLAVEGAPAASVLHAVAEQGITTREIAEAIGRSLGVPVESRPAESFGWIGGFFGMDASVSNDLTRERTGWAPTQPGLVADIAAGSYLDAAPNSPL